MSDVFLEQVRTEVAELASERDELTAKLGALVDQLAERIAETRSAASIGHDTTMLAKEGRVANLRRARRRVVAELAAIDASVRQAVGAFVEAGFDPCDAESDVPLLLLPVRLETRFADGGATLRVRIYPDAAHLDRLDAGLTVDERAAGRAYWSAVWDGGVAGEDGAWRQLLGTVHRERAAWVAFSLTPDNLAQRFDAGVQPEFPDVPPCTRRPPMARCLPDHFVVAAVQANAVRSATGAPVPSEVTVGLPRDDDPSSLVGADGAVLPPGMAWMADFEEAVAIGLGVEVRLAAAGAPVDLLLAFGIHSSVSPANSANELQRLFIGHRFGGGAAFVPQGTPTNNTEADRAGWTRRPEPLPPPTTAAARAPVEGSNAAVLARALGLGGEVLAGVQDSELHEQGLAGAAHAALWGPSWGTFLERMLMYNPGGILDDAQTEALRSFYITHVRGRGPLPAVRLGNQPYGVLPVTAFDAGFAADGSDPIEAGLVNILRTARPIWTAGVENVPTVGGVGVTGPLDERLLEILGSSPQLLALRVRSIASEAACSIVPPLLGIFDEDTARQHLFDSILWQLLGLAPGVLGFSGALGKTTRPLGLPLADDNDPAYIDALLNDTDRKVSSVVQALLELALDAERRAVAAAAPRALIPEVTELAFRVADDLAGPIVEMTRSVDAGEAGPDELHVLADKISEKFGPAGPVQLALTQPVAGLRDSLGSIAIEAGGDFNLAGGLAINAMQAWFRAQARLAEVEAAMRSLSTASTSARRIAVAEALDCASHRFDAWATALVTRRLADRRRTVPQGILLGAYGWVENLRPGATTTRDGGYLLAPSVAQAATAGVLRSAYLHHNPSADGSGAFAIDLTSTRVRNSLSLLQGIRNGQTLGALLGYRFERLLQESSRQVQRFILSLRAIAPLVGGNLTSRGDAIPQPAREALGATDVVDGVMLLHLRDTGVDIRAALAVAPDNPYLTTPWTPPTGPEWQAISDAMDEIAAQYDAAADLLLAESVHQLVQGNTARAAATLDAAAGGDAVPVDPDVVKTPLRGTAITHRALALVPDHFTGTAGWTTTTPRAAAEPRLEAWAESILGPADAVVVQVRQDGTPRTLDAADLAALDVVYDAADFGTLEQRIRAAMPGLSNDPLVARSDPNWPSRLRALGEIADLGASVHRTLAEAEAALPRAFARAGEKGTRFVSNASMSEFTDRLDAALSSLTATANALAAVLAQEAPDTAALAAAVVDVAAFGIPLIGEGPEDFTTAPFVLAEANRRIESATALRSGAVELEVSVGLEMGKALFGESFWVLPLVSRGTADLFGASIGRVTPRQGAIRRFIRDLASVRKPLARFAEMLLFGEAVVGRRRLQVVQLAPSGTPGANRWLALEVDPTTPSPKDPVTILVVDSPVVLKSEDRFAGLILDEWVEIAPTRTVRGENSDEPVVESMVTTGVAANVDVPDSRAPQAILLAMSPDQSRWSTSKVAAVLTETLELAKLRTVSLERVPWAGRILPALQEQSASLQGSTAMDIAMLVNVLATSELMLSFVKEAE